MKKTTYLLIACMISLLIGGLYYFLKEEPLIEKHAKTAPPVAQQPSILSYQGNSITEEKDGKRLWELGAESIEVDTTTKNAILHNIDGTFYQEKGGSIHIKAPMATVDNATKEIVMTGKVQAVASDGATFTAQEAHWLGQAQQFSGSGDVIVTKEDTIMTGDRVDSDSNMEKMKVSGHAKIVKGGAPQ